MGHVLSPVFCVCSMVGGWVVPQVVGRPAPLYNTPPNNWLDLASRFYNEVRAAAPRAAGRDCCCLSAVANWLAGWLMWWCWVAIWLHRPQLVPWGDASKGLQTLAQKKQAMIVKCEWAGRQAGKRWPPARGWMGV